MVKDLSTIITCVQGLPFSLSFITCTLQNISNFKVDFRDVSCMLGFRLLHSPMKQCLIIRCEITK